MSRYSIDKFIDRIDTFPPVVETKVDGYVLRNFMTKMQPPIYSQYCDYMLGRSDEKTQPMIDPGRCSERDFSNNILNDSMCLLSSNKNDFEFEISQAYSTLKTVHILATDPDGLRIMNYISLITLCLRIAQRIEKKRFPKFIDSFYRTLCEDKLTTCKQFIADLNDPDSEVATLVLDGIERRDRCMNTWVDKDKWTQLLRKLGHEANTFCLSQKRNNKIKFDQLVKLFQKEEDDHTTFQGRIGLPGVYPYWMFYTCNAVEYTNIPVKSILSKQQYIRFSQLTQMKATKTRDALLQEPAIRRAWNAFSKLVVLYNIFTGQEMHWVQTQCYKGWKNMLSRSDFSRKTDVLRKFTEEIQTRSETIPQKLLEVFCKLISTITLELIPLPPLERGDEYTDDRIDVMHKQMLHAEIMSNESLPPLEEQLAERRKQMVMTNTSQPSSDKGAVLPIFLLGALIFLMVN